MIIGLLLGLGGVIGALVYIKRLRDKNAYDNEFEGGNVYEKFIDSKLLIYEFNCYKLYTLKNIFSKDFNTFYELL